MAADNINENPEITVTTVARDKRGRFVSVKKPDQVKPQVNLEASLKEILKFLVDNQKSTLDLYNSQSEKIDKTNDHLGNIENELSNLEKYFGQLTSFFSKKDEEDQKDAIENSFQKINNQHLKNILIVEQKQLKELEMLNEQFIDFFEMNEKNIQDQKEQTIEREREAAAPPPTIEQPKQEAAKDIKKNEGMFSGFGSIVKNTFGGLLGIGKGIFKGLGTIFSTLFSIVSVPFKFISSALGSILSFIPGFGIISKFMPSFSMGMGGLLSTLGIGALGYVGFKYLTDDKYKAGVDKYMGGITKFFSPFINAIKGFFDTPIGQAISSFVGNLWKEYIQPALKTTWEAIKTGIDDFGKTFLGEENWGQLKKSFFSITEWITDKLPKSYEELSRTVKIMAINVVGGLKTILMFLESIPWLGRKIEGVSDKIKIPFQEMESNIDVSGGISRKLGQGTTISESGGDYSRANKDVNAYSYGAYQMYTDGALGPFLKWLQNKNPEVYKQLSSGESLTPDELLKQAKQGEKGKFFDAWKKTFAGNRYKELQDEFMLSDQANYGSVISRLNAVIDTQTRQSLGNNLKNRSLGLNEMIFDLANASPVIAEKIIRDALAGKDWSALKDTEIAELIKNKSIEYLDGDKFYTKKNHPDDTKRQNYIDIMKKRVNKNYARVKNEIPLEVDQKQFEKMSDSQMAARERGLNERSIASAGIGAGVGGALGALTGGALGYMGSGIFGVYGGAKKGFYAGAALGGSYGYLEEQAERQFGTTNTMLAEGLFGGLGAGVTPIIPTFTSLYRLGKLGVEKEKFITPLSEINKSNLTPPKQFEQTQPINIINNSPSNVNEGGSTTIINQVMNPLNILGFTDLTSRPNT